MELFYDLHIHSCLSPCAEDEMTPGNIAGMAYVKGIDMIAVTDHNTARNLPAAQAAAEEYGILFVPGIEITTREEVHLLGYFPDTAAALACGEKLYPHLPARKNKPKLFGNQFVMNGQDEITGEEDALLIGAADLSLSECAALVRSLGGVPVPAHINRGSNGLMINLGFLPEEPFFPALEVWPKLPCDMDTVTGKHLLHSSDAHRLEDMAEREYMLRLGERSVRAFLDWLTSPKNA